MYVRVDRNTLVRNFHLDHSNVLVYSGVFRNLCRQSFSQNVTFHRYKVADVRAIVEKYENIAETLDTVKDKEQFLLNCKSIFHPNHFIPFLIKFSLCMVSQSDFSRVNETERAPKSEIWILEYCDILSHSN